MTISFLHLFLALKLLRNNRFSTIPVPCPWTVGKPTVWTAHGQQKPLPTIRPHSAHRLRLPTSRHSTIAVPACRASLAPTRPPRFARVRPNFEIMPKVKSKKHRPLACFKTTSWRFLPLAPSRRPYEKNAPRGRFRPPLGRRPPVGR